MPTLVGKTITSARTLLGTYPVIYLTAAGAPFAGDVPANSTICVQKPGAGVALTGDAAVLSVAPHGGRC